jgi:aspartate carbamoyltransferase catalytic subunit
MRNRWREHRLLLRREQDHPTETGSMTEQIDSSGRLRHLLTLEGLPREVLLRLLDRAQALREHACGGTALRGTLAGKAVCNLFFEPSTRTRSSFRLAATRLGADTFDFDASTSSTK